MYLRHPPKVTAEIARRIKAGEFVSHIARECGVGTGAVYTVARQQNLTIAKPTFAQTGRWASDAIKAKRAGHVRLVMSVQRTPEHECMARMASLRNW